jgi:hypothetical protein
MLFPVPTGSPSPCGVTSAGESSVPSFDGASCDRIRGVIAEVLGRDAGNAGGAP